MTYEEKNNIVRIETNVKWYHPEKGYGFLTHEAIPEDIMIHFSTLDAVKCPYVKEGDRVTCDVGPGRRGLHVIRVLNIEYGSPEERSLDSFPKSRAADCDPSLLKELRGYVKWYNPKKGYGFIIPDDGEKEIFLHSSIMRDAGFKSLIPGARVAVKVSHSNRGYEVHSLRVLSEEEERVSA